jgi:hypothetical protein
MKMKCPLFKFMRNFDEPETPSKWRALGTCSGDTHKSSPWRWVMHRCG